MEFGGESACPATNIQEALGFIPSAESTTHGGVCLCSQLEGGEGKRLRNPRSSLAVNLVQSQAGYMRFCLNEKEKSMCVGR